jgi:salicylate 5-hydroxylase large subunit
MTAADASSVFPSAVAWESDGTSRIPFGVYTHDELHRKELDRFFTASTGAT